MNILGSAIGMAGGFAILVIVLWRFPKARQNVFSAPFPDTTIFTFMVFALFGGWIGYWIAATLFHG